MVARTCSPRYWGGWGKRIARTQEAEIAVSWDCATALQTGNRARACLKKKKKRKKFAYYSTVQREEKWINITNSCIQMTKLCFLNTIPGKKKIKILRPFYGLSPRQMEDWCRLKWQTDRQKMLAISTMQAPEKGTGSWTGDQCPWKIFIMFTKQGN